jgi:hypothetical protein
MYLLSIVLLLKWVCGFELWNYEDTYPPCPPYGDNIDGVWVETKNFTTTESQKELNRHFWLGPPGEALNFTRIWLPNGCSYHRFTKDTFFNLMKDITSSHKDIFTEGKVHITVFGDSGTRGIICGIVRMLSGSEVLGPCENRICGESLRAPGHSTHPASMDSHYNVLDLPLGDHFVITYVYVYGTYPFENRDWRPEFLPEYLKRDFSTTGIPYAVMYNTGIWDFFPYDALHNPDLDICDSKEAFAVMFERNREEVIQMFNLSSMVAQERKHMRLIYRNSHYNVKYPVLCADELLEANLRNSSKIKFPEKWELFDNRPLSKNIYRFALVDGFHYDRIFIHSVEEHHQHIHHVMVEQRKETPGMLEMQFAQSFLHSVFHPFLLEKYNQEKERNLKTVETPKQAQLQSQNNNNDNNNNQKNKGYKGFTIKLVYHAYANPAATHWEGLFKSQLQAILNSGLFDIVNEFHVALNTGPERNAAVMEQASQVILGVVPNAIIHTKDAVGHYEYDGIHKSWELARNTPTVDQGKTIVGYFHSKGGMNSRSANQLFDGRNADNIMLTRIVLEDWEYVFNNFAENPNLLTAGMANTCGHAAQYHNFWWARASYLALKEDPNSQADRHYYEFWLETGDISLDVLPNATLSLCEKYYPVKVAQPPICDIGFFDPDHPDATDRNTKNMKYAVVCTKEIRKALNISLFHA